LIKFIREVSRAPHYRHRPAEALRYAYAKWMFYRYRQNDPRAFLEGTGIDIRLALDGFERWRPQLERVVSIVQGANDGQGGISLEDGMILYGLTRALQPEYLIETGVAAGVSTCFFGAALMENRRGTLFSIELSPAMSPLRHSDGSTYLWQEKGVGWAIPYEIKRSLGYRHRLILQDVRQALPEILRTLRYVDIFFHDDLHTPERMLWEYELVWPKLRPGGVLVSDDVNHGWIQFCDTHRQNGRALHNIERLCVLRKPFGSASESDGENRGAGVAL
jgi:predicted O-methyltransferase YrrM